MTLRLIHVAVKMIAPTYAQKHKKHLISVG